MTVLDYLRNSAEKYPQKTAFRDEHKDLTYEVLLLRTKSVATVLIKDLCCVREPVAVMIDRNVESICAFMGIAMSRNFYVPIDVSQPSGRIRTILEQMQPAAVISIGDNIPEEIAGWLTIPCLRYEDMISAEPDEERIAERTAGAMDTDPLYAICTSGSTGVPKGVLISHRSVMDFIPVFTETFGFSAEDIFGNQAPFDFDVSVKDIYSTLYLGAETYIIPKVCFAMPKLLVDALDIQKVTVVIWAVSALCIAAGVNAFKHKVPGYLKKILFSGEVMPIKMLNIWRKNIPDAMYVNLYGPTEITCNCMYYIIDREFGNTDKLPLGLPFANENVMVLTDEGRPVKTGETGEICVTGTCLALGYYRNPEKTAEAFVQNPLNDRYPELMYKTGDMAVLAEDGEYYFAARRDFQIKHMGHRIELEEIETYIGAVEGVSRVSCLFDENRNKIVACYSGDIERIDIISEVKKSLPKYMIPNIFMKMEQLPLNKNGKIDRQQIKRIYFEGE